MEGESIIKLKPAIEITFFHHKRIIVIGAAGSVGKACCIWLLNHGAKVVLVSRNMKEIQSVADQFPNQTICIQCDLTSDEQQLDMVKGGLEALGGLDILINCQGVFFENDLQSCFPQDHDYLTDINLRSVFLISQYCSGALSESKGSIVNVSGISRPQQGMISFTMSKNGLNTLTKCLALELSPVRVNAVSPGFITNNFLKTSSISEKELSVIKSRLRNNNPLKRLARVDEVVKGIILLCSDHNITGQIINIDGGLNTTNSCFVHWDCSTRMNSAILASGLKPVYQMANWVGKKVDKVIPKDKPETWMSTLLGRSMWSTDMADAHIKVYENYDKLNETEDLIGIISELKGESEIFDRVEGGYSPRMSHDRSFTKQKLARGLNDSVDLSPVRRSSIL